MSNNKDAIISLRRAILVCSYIYYQGPGLPADVQSPYSDAMYDNWAHTLRTLSWGQKNVGFYDEAFADWGDGGNFSGFALPRDDYVREEAIKLLAQY